MRRNRQNIFMAATLLLLAGCGNDNETATPDGGDRVALQVSSGIQTRATDNAWAKDDAIGIYMLEAGTSIVSENADNRRYFTADGSTAFTATADQTIYFPIDGKTVDFIAYYPQQTLTNGSLTIDVSKQTDLDLPKIDLLAAKVQSTEGTPYDKLHPKVTFNFYHKLTKLELNIAYGTGLTEKDLEGLTVEITKQRTEASYTPLTATLALNSDEIAQAVTLNTAADGKTAEAILLPNSDEFNPSTDRELVFTLYKTGEKFRWTISGEKDFIAGDRNIYNITINRSGLEVTATIENWNLGNGEKGENGSAE